jgi:hypothetical protein
VNTKLTLDQHREMGAEMKAFRHERLIHYVTSIKDATPLNSPQAKAAQNALDALDELRNVMDDLVFKDYFDEIGDEFKEIYYCVSDRDWAMPLKDLPDDDED